MARKIAERLFTDGVTREVYEDAGGQFVLDDFGNAVNGVWLLSVAD